MGLAGNDLCMMSRRRSSPRRSDASRSRPSRRRKRCSLRSTSRTRGSTPSSRSPAQRRWRRRGRRGRGAGRRDAGSTPRRPGQPEGLIRPARRPLRRSDRRSSPRRWQPRTRRCVERLKRADAVISARRRCRNSPWKAIVALAAPGDAQSLDSGLHAGRIERRAARRSPRLGPLAVGTDGGGSIRIPAAFTRIYGLKPSSAVCRFIPRARSTRCRMRAPSPARWRTRRCSFR